MENDEQVNYENNFAKTSKKKIAKKGFQPLYQITIDRRVQFT